MYVPRWERRLFGAKARGSEGLDRREEGVDEAAAGGDGVVGLELKYRLGGLIFPSRKLLSSAVQRTSRQQSV